MSPTVAALKKKKKSSFYFCPATVWLVNSKSIQGSLVGKAAKKAAARCWSRVLGNRAEHAV